MQEIENEYVLKIVLKKLPQYKHYHFIKKRDSPIGLAVISKEKIVEKSVIKVKSKITRDIQKTTILLDEKISFI